MDKTEFMNNAEHIFNDAIKSAMGKAYDLGYEQGKHDVAESQAAEKEHDPEAKSLKWIDFGLPSGKLWAVVSTSSKYEKSYKIPSLEELSELARCIKTETWISSSNRLWLEMKVVGLSGENLIIYNYQSWSNTHDARAYFNSQHKSAYVWIKSELDADWQHKCMKITNATIPTDGDLKKYYDTQYEVIDRYSGDECMLLICKDKEL